jgi:hypothetical protein
MDLESPSTQPAPKTLPFSNWWPVVAGALMGIALRLVFSTEPGSAYSAMAWPFITFAPIAIGAVTVYVAEKKARRSWGYYVRASALAATLTVLGTLLIMIEGLICAFIIFPLFALLGIVGGLAMGVVCRTTNWPKHAAYSFAVLPVFLAPLAPPDQAGPRLFMTERHVAIPAPPGAIWRHLLDAPDIRPDEVDQAWMYRIGVPLPRSGVTQATPAGLVRHVTMGKGIHFDQVAESWQSNRYVRWQYRFAADSFPPKALDDHVRIGGHYFDLVDTEYQLTPEKDGTTLLNIRMHYRVSTGFNWYAVPVARLLIGNFEDVILRFYRQRALGHAG